MVWLNLLFKLAAIWGIIPSHILNGLSGEQISSEEYNRNPVGTGPCYENVFPSGWGGAVTDSIVQGIMGGPGVQGAAEEDSVNKVFAQDYSTGEQNFYDARCFEDIV